MKAQGTRHKAQGTGERHELFLPTAYCLLPSAFRVAACLLPFAFLLMACAVDERRSGLMPEAQTVIDQMTDDIAQSRFDKIYAETAAEWRGAATPEESRQALERLRSTLGKVVSRTFVSGKDQQGTNDGSAPHTLTVIYNTRFERANGMENFTLVERQGRWQLARYFVNSDALK